MFNFAKIDRHAELMNRMAETVGTDLGDAVIRGEMSGEQYRSALLACTRCAHPAECEHFLVSHADGAAAAPDFCRNATLMDRLSEKA